MTYILASKDMRAVSEIPHRHKLSGTAQADG